MTGSHKSYIPSSVACMHTHAQLFTKDSNGEDRRASLVSAMSLCCLFAVSLLFDVHDS